MIKRGLACLLLAAMILCIVPGFAEKAQVSVYVYGKTLMTDGSVEQVPVQIEFTVTQNGETMGTLISSTGAAVTVDGSSAVVLVPTEESLHMGWLINARGYQMAVTEGALNQTSIEVWSDKGSFEALGVPGCVYVLREAESDEILAELTADENGLVRPEEMIAGGDYTLQDAAGTFAPVSFTVAASKGDASMRTLVELPEVGQETVAEPEAETEAEPETETVEESETEAETEAEPEVDEETEDEPEDEPAEEPETRIENLPDLEPVEESEPAEEDSRLNPDRERTDIAPRKLPTREDIAGSGQSSLTVQVFHDGNRSSEMNPQEHGMANIPVQLIYHDPKNGDAIVASVHSDADGRVYFTELPEGEYSIGVTLPTGYSYSEKSQKRMTIRQNIMEQSSSVYQESCVITLPRNSALETAVAAAQTGGVTGQVWFDANTNGLLDAGENGVAGVLMELEGVHSNAIYQVISAADGSYTFDQVRPGDYYLRCYLPDGMMFAARKANGNGIRTVITGEGRSTGRKQVKVERAAVVNKQYVGLIKGAGVKITAYEDSNLNGVMDPGEKPLPGVQLTLSKQGNGEEVSTVTSDINGLGNFGALRVNTYKVKARIPEGWHYAPIGTGANANRFFSEERRDNTLQNINITSPEEDVVICLGAYRAASVTGTVYLDANYSGERESDEKVFDEMTLTLLGEDGLVAATAKTNTRGEYRFSEIKPGTYTLTLTAKSGYAFTREGAGNVMINRGKGTGSTEAFTLLSGESRQEMNCGMIKPAVINGEIFADLNDNGVKDEGETGMVGSVAVLGSQTGENLGEIQIGEDGVYSFDAVMPGTYFLYWELPENCIFVTPMEGMIVEGNIASSAYFTLQSGNVANVSPIGGLRYGTVEGVVFEDVTADGTRAEDERGMAGVTLTLTPTRGDREELSVTTDESGAFRFEQLRPDDWTLAVSMPENYVVSYQNEEMQLGLTTGVGSQEVTLSLPMGQELLDQQLGSVIPAEFHGLAWLDENLNGQMNDEAAAVGEEIQVIREATGETVTILTTDEKGAFDMTGVIPGTYTLVYAMDRDTIPANEGDSTFTAAGESELRMTGMTLAGGEERSDLRLGLVRYTSVTGSAWFDDGEKISACAGMPVSLMNDRGEVLGTATTTEEGQYGFGGLLPGSYSLRAEFPDGCVPIEKGDRRLEEQNLTSVLGIYNGRTGISDPITIRMGQNQTGLDLGSVRPGKLGDLVWLDLNANGLQDWNEGGIPNVTVHLTRDGKEIATTTTDAYGFFLFEDLYPAAYVLTADTGLTPTQYIEALPAITSHDGVPVEVESGAANYDADLGYLQSASGKYPQGYGAGDKQNWIK